MEGKGRREGLCTRETKERCEKYKNKMKSVYTKLHDEVAKFVFIIIIILVFFTKD